MTFSQIWKTSLAVAAIGTMALGANAVSAQAADWKAARAAGLIGEQPDGYLGIVGAATPELRAMVNDINIRRKQSYTQKAQQTGSTVEQFALTSGCNLIELTPEGTNYLDPTGTWRTRTSAAPIRHPSCI